MCLKVFRNVPLSFEVLDQDVLFFVRAAAVSVSAGQKTTTAAKCQLAGSVKVPKSILDSQLWPKYLWGYVGELNSGETDVTSTTDCVRM